MTNKVYDFTQQSLDTATRFVVLVLEEIALVLPQHEIKALEPALDVKASILQTADANQASVAGELALAEGTCPVYAFDADLRCLSTIPSPHRICAILHKGQQNHHEQYAVSCVEVRLIARSKLALHEIPRLLKQKSPVKSLIVSDGQLLLGTTAAALFAHVASRIDAQVLPFDERLRRTKA